MTTRTTRSSVKAHPDTIEIADDRVFGPGGGALARRFARCVLQFSEVRSLALNPAQETATVNYQLANGDLGSFMTRLASAVAAPAAGVNETVLPRWTDDTPVTLYRHSGVISIFEDLHIENGYLTIRHPAMERDQAIARTVENALRVVPGVIRATVKGKLDVRFDRHAVAVVQLIRLTEAKTIEQLIGVGAPASKQVDFALANVSVGAAAVSDLILPPMMPATAALLVVSNLATFGAAADQLRRGEIGLPLLYTSIVGVTLASGQFLSAALMLWCFRYWEGRYRHDLEVESQALLDDSVGLPEEVRVLTADGLERMVPTAKSTWGNG